MLVGGWRSMAFSRGRPALSHIVRSHVRFASTSAVSPSLTITPTQPNRPVPNPPPPFFSSAGPVNASKTHTNDIRVVSTPNFLDAILQNAARSGVGSADEAIESMNLEQLVQQLFDGSWSGHDTISALEQFNRLSYCQCATFVR